jgi:hypothetical protein
VNLIVDQLDQFVLRLAWIIRVKLSIGIIDTLLRQSKLGDRVMKMIAELLASMKTPDCVFKSNVRSVLFSPIDMMRH